MYCEGEKIGIKQQQPTRINQQDREDKDNTYWSIMRRQEREMLELMLRRESIPTVSVDLVTERFSDYVRDGCANIPIRLS